MFALCIIHKYLAFILYRLWVDGRLMPFRPLFPCVPIDQVISASQRTQGNKGRKGISLGEWYDFGNPMLC